jgi:hypothetical protein
LGWAGQIFFNGNFIGLGSLLKARNLWGKEEEEEEEMERKKEKRKRRRRRNGEEKEKKKKRKKNVGLGRPGLRGEKQKK